jgi:hypothetical protein
MNKPNGSNCPEQTNHTRWTPYKRSNDPGVIPHDLQLLKEKMDASPETFQGEAQDRNPGTPSSGTVMVPQSARHADQSDNVGKISIKTEKERKKGTTSLD